jgi:hypothetical protein
MFPTINQATIFHSNEAFDNAATIVSPLLFDGHYASCCPFKSYIFSALPEYNKTFPFPCKDEITTGMKCQVY